MSRRLRTRARPRTVLLDANLLCLLLVGSHDPSLIRRHKRTRSYTVEDFHLLVRYTEGFQRALTTPNILTEVSNLLDKPEEPSRDLLMGLLARYAQSNSVKEHYLPSGQASQQAEFKRLGLSDTAILEVADADVLVLTADLHLYIALQKRGVEAVNFHHLRSHLA